MSNIREYVKTKDQPEKEKLQGKITHHRRSIFYRLLLFILVIIGIFGVLYIQWNNKIYKSYDVLTSVEKQEISDTETIELSGNILTYSKDGISCSNVGGEAVWNQTFEMQEPLIETSKDKVAIGDYNGRTIYVMDTTQVLGEITTNLPIRYFAVSAGGVVATVLEDTDITWIYVYDDQGGVIAKFRTTMDQSGYPVAVNISDSSEIVNVSYLKVVDDKMVTSVAYYNFGDVGQNASSDRLVSAYDYSDMVVPTLGFLDDETSFAVSDSRIMFYKGKQKPVSENEIILQDEVHSVFYGDGYVGLVYIDTSGENKYRMDVYNTTGKLILQKAFNIEYSNILFTNKNILIYNPDQCILCNMAGTEKYNGTFEKQIQIIIPTAKANRFVLVGGEYIDTIELK